MSTKRVTFYDDATNKKIKVKIIEDGSDKSSDNDKSYDHTLISVKNPKNVEISDGLRILTDWTFNISDVFQNFNELIGKYQIPEDGDYQISLVVNYQTDTPFIIDSSLTKTPFIEINETTNNNNIVSSPFPIVDTIITIPPPGINDVALDIRNTSVLRKGQIIINSVFSFCEGQKICVCVTNLDPNTPSINFSPNDADTTLTIVKLKDTKY